MRFYFLSTFIFFVFFKRSAYCQAQDNLDLYYSKVYEAEELIFKKQYRQANVRAGKMMPELFAFLNDGSGDYKVNEGFGQMNNIIQFANKLYKPKYSNNCMVEEQRKKYYLCNLDLNQKKIIINKTSSAFTSFKLYSLTTGFTVYDDNMPQEIIDNNYTYTGVEIK